MKRKVILTITIILLITLSLIIYNTFIKENKKVVKENLLEITDIQEIQNLKDKRENVKSVTIVKQTEGGRYFYIANLDETIEMLSNIKIIGKTNVSIMDNDIIYVFNFNNGDTMKIEFEGRYLHYKNENYEVDGYKGVKLTEIENPEL